MRLQAMVSGIGVIWGLTRDPGTARPNSLSIESQSISRIAGLFTWWPSTSAAQKGKLIMTLMGPWYFCLFGTLPPQFFL